MHWRPAWVLAWGVAALVLTANCAWGGTLLSSETLEFELFVNDRFHILSDFFNSGEKKFNQDRSLHILYVNPTIAAPLGHRMQAVFELEAEFLFDFHNHAGDDETEVRNAYLEALLPGLDWVRVSAGRHALSTVQGLVYDDSTEAIVLQADLERGFDWPYKFKALVAEVENDSPYFQAELTYNFSFIESISLYYGWFRDTRSGIAGIFNNLEGERIYKSRGRIRWMGLSLKKFLGNFLLRTTLLYEHGSVRLRERDMGSRTLQTRGYLADLNCDYSFNRNLSASLFFYVSSGDSRPESGTLRSFVSIDPYVDKTNIFFNGGIEGQLSSDNAGLNGVQLAGVMAPGLALDCRVGQKANIKLILAYLLAHKGSGGQGRRYGWEANAMAYYNLSEKLQIFFEFNLFAPGGYFRRLTDHRDHVSTEIIFGVNYFFRK